MATWNKVLNLRYPITSLYQYFKSDGTGETLSVVNKYVNRVTDGKLTRLNGQLDFDKAKMITYKSRTAKDIVLIADGGKLKRYDGTSIGEVLPHVPTDGTNGTPEETKEPGLNDLVNLTQFRTFALKKDRVYAAAHPTVKNRLSFSYFDPYLGFAVYDYFPATYFIDIAVEDNDEIIELRVFRDTLIIFCKRSVWALHGDGASIADLQLIKINVPKGCISPGSVQEVGNNLFYLADDHVYSLYSTDQSYISAKMVSEPIEPILESVALIEKEAAAATFYKGKYYLSFPSGLTLVYDSVIESWTKFTNIKASSYLEKDGELLFSSSDGYIYRFNEKVFSDDGTPIPFSMKTKIIDFNAPVHRKKIKRIWVIQRQFDKLESEFKLFGTFDQHSFIDLNVLNENTGLGGVWDRSDWDDALWDFGEITQNEIKIRQKSKTLQLQIENNKPDEPLTIYGVVIEYQIKKP
ncbi:hypothetical protein [Cytobacillus sp. FSL R5-0596]|uniref:hypothetical protein n=1 Tax=Cytobacillus sp. FSL R5-0596 TaxID=2954696 RepID=UPI0030F4CD59